MKRRFGAFCQIDSLPARNITMACDFKLPFHFFVAQLLSVHRFDHHLLEFSRISLVLLSLGYKNHSPLVI